MRIKVKKPQFDFTMVPNHAARTLPSDALAVLVWAMTHADGFTLHVKAIRERFDWGEDKWRRVRKELEHAGALETVTTRQAANGQLAGRGLIVRWPTPTGEMDESDRNPGFPGLGKPGDAHPGNPRVNTRETPVLNKTDKKDARARPKPVDPELFEEWLRAGTGESFEQWSERNGR